eukprot:m51a1_g7347 hypothetical protein (166) ;mRNA; f:225166-225902
MSTAEAVIIDGEEEEEQEEEQEQEQVVAVPAPAPATAVVDGEEDEEDECPPAADAQPLQCAAPQATASAAPGSASAPEKPATASVPASRFPGTITPMERRIRERNDALWKAVSSRWTALMTQTNRELALSSSILANSLSTVQDAAKHVRSGNADLAQIVALTGQA